MFKILDRYVVREIALPFAIALTVLTFVLMIPPILQRSEALIARGVELSTVARALAMLAPQALSLTIPMAVLFGTLIGLGRVSADREFVAMQACGLSLLRLARPVAIVALLATAATAYQIIIALPGANQTFREIAAGIMAERIEGDLRPRVFFEEFPHRVIYVRDVPPEGAWRDVFVGDLSRPDFTTVYFARTGRIDLDPERQLVQLRLSDGMLHTTRLSEPEAYESTQFESFTITLDPQTVFAAPPPKGAPEKTLAELRETIAEAAVTGDPAYDARFMIQYKLSFPTTCLVLAMIGLGLGANSHRGGRLASFAVGLGVILVYYVLLYGARALALGGRLSPDWAPWIPNALMGIAAVALIAWRVRAEDRPIRFSVPVFWRPAPPTTSPDVAVRAISKRPRVVVVIRLPHLNLPAPRLLDLYVARQYARLFTLGVAGLLAIFYISTFIDLVDKLFRGQATTSMLLRYFYFETPQFLYFVVPIAVLVAALVSIGLLTKSNELLVMRACGISLYRTAAPLMIFALAAGGFLFVLQEQVLARTNRESDRLEALIRGYPPPLSALSQRWRVGTMGAIYHYDSFDPVANRFSRLQIYQVSQEAWRLEGMTHVNEAALVRGTDIDGGALPVWKGMDGWSRSLAPVRSERQGATVRYATITERELTLEPPDYFLSVVPIAEQMTYGELRDYIAQLQTSGAYVVPYLVALQRKLAFPFVTVIMTMLALPFAVTTGSRGALYGIGIGVVIAIIYWISMSLFGALGAGGVLTPVLAAWAPNILFGAAAAYMILTVRT